MKVLLLTQLLPHPPDSGPKVKTAAVLRSLSQHHEVTLASFVRGDEHEAVDHLRKFIRAVRTVPMQRGSTRDAWYLARSVLEREPFLILRDSRSSMRRLVAELLHRERFDIIHVDQLSMAQYCYDAALRSTPSTPRPARLLDAHNALWLVCQRLAEATAGRFRRVLLQREARLLKEYEGRICRDFDAVTAVSQQDARALREAAASPVEIGVVPITIDVGEVTVVQRRPDANRILYLGSLIWPPSLDGLLWFLRDVLPLIVAKRPDAEVDVVGANPPEEILASSKRDLRIRVHGYVADPTSILESAAVMVVPLRAGGGMRVRILNGLAHGVPIVSTTIGCEGIAVESGRDLLIADSPVAFADSVLQLLDDRELGASMSRAGRRLIEERYDSRAMGDAIESEYRRAIERRNRELR